MKPCRADYTLLQSKSKPLTDCFTLAGSSEGNSYLNRIKVLHPQKRRIPFWRSCKNETVC